MQRLFLFIIRNDVWIYILCALGLFWYLSELIRAQRILRRAMFGLEWETGSRMRNTSMVAILILTGVASIVFYVNRNIAPNLPAELLTPPTATPDIFATPLASPTPLARVLAQEEQQPTPHLAATVTLAGQPAAALLADADAEAGDEVQVGLAEAAGTLTPAATPAEAAPAETAEAAATPFVACNDVLNVAQPQPGAAVGGTISILGTANTAELQYYELDINGPQTQGEWVPLLAQPVERAVEGGLLGTADVSTWPAGPYLIRLRATNLAGLETGQCVTQVTITGN